MTDPATSEPDHVRQSHPPSNPLPPQACDCHTHIIDTGGKYPFRRQTGQALPNVPFERHENMLRTVGFERAVLVQLIAYGEDNSLLVDSLELGGGRLRGIAALRATVTDAELERLHAAGVRGLRFYEKPGPHGVQYRGGADMNDLAALAPRMRELNWCAEIAGPSHRLVEWAPLLQSLRIPVVLEHMAGCQGADGTQNPAFKTIVALHETGWFWTKLTVCRMSRAYPDFVDMRPLQECLATIAPSRLLWGSDWPHGLMGSNSPDVGHLLDLFDEWIDGDAVLRHQILSQNPASLFDFPSA